MTLSIRFYVFINTNINGQVIYLLLVDQLLVIMILLVNTKCQYFIQSINQSTYMTPFRIRGPPKALVFFLGMQKQGKDNKKNR